MLLVEDSESDAALIEHELVYSGYLPRVCRVDGPDTMVAALRHQDWDLILCDFNLPGFNAFDALELVRRHVDDVPLIVLSGTIGEETAVQVLKAGARDCVLKANLSRIGPVIERELLEAEARRQQREVEESARQNFELLQKANEERRRLLDRLVRAQEEERARIANDIHDDSVQVMTALVIRLDALRRRLGDEELVGVVDDIERTARNSIKRLRHLMFELRPAALDRDGLVPALHLYLQSLTEEHGLEYELADSVTTEPGPESRAILYRIAQEALTNVVKHAGATRIHVTVCQEDGGTVVRISDDGCGLPAGIQSVPGHLGLASMRERAELSGGWWQIASPPEGGTVVEYFVPEAKAMRS